MCSECGGDYEPVCHYCGGTCFGSCDDPDVCRSCWHPIGLPWEDISDDLEEQLDQCIDEGCLCKCHEDMWNDLEHWVEAGVLKSVDEHGERYQREGTFPFLKLPGETREKIYGFAFLQDGNQRESGFHRGTIHTALLSTCRQIYNEACHLPLTVNKLCFGSAIFAHHFLGFLLQPPQQALVTSMHIELYMDEFPTSSWTLLLRELAKTPISHLSLTVKGGVTGKEFTGHTCFTNRFKVLKLKTFDLTLTSAHIKAEEKKDIQENMRKALIKDYSRPKELKNAKAKRAASADFAVDPRTATKKPKKANALHKHQTKIVASPKSSRLSIKSTKPERDAAQAAKERVKQTLLDQYGQLKQYATSIDSDAAPVKIRLKQAHEAAEAVDEKKFEKLAHGIFLTLEERYNKIANARKDIPVFPPPSPSPEPSSSPESTASSLDSQELSQLSE